MKTLFYSLSFVLLLHNHTNAQNPGCPSPNTPGWFDTDWDWTISTNTQDAPYRWKAYVNSGSPTPTLDVLSPFTNGGTNEVDDLTYTQDYKPKQGWVLLYKHFGYIDPFGLNNIPAQNDVPTFILYNKYRSLVRVFMYANTGNINYAYMNVQWQSPTVSQYNNSMLTMGRTNLLPSSTYSTIGTNSDKISVHINDYTNHEWMVAEFPMHFDPTTNPQTFGQRLLFYLRNGTTSNIDMDGNYSFSTQSAAAKDPPNAANNTSNGNPVYDYVNQAKEFIGKVPTRSELSANFTKMANASASLSANPKFKGKFTDGIATINTALQGDFKDYLLGIADVAEFAGGAVGLAGTLLKTFIGKADPDKANDSEKYIEPTISSGFLTLSGTIQTETNARILDFQVPGTKHKDGAGCDNYFGMPYYDCPLGVLAIEETPMLNKKTCFVPKQESYVNVWAEFFVPAVVLGTSCDPANITLPPNQTLTPLQDVYHPNTNIFTGRIMRRTGNYGLSHDSMRINSFQLDGKVKLALNEAAGLELVSAKAALYFEIDKRANNQPAVALQSYSYAPYIDTTFFPNGSYAVTYIGTPADLTNNWGSPTCDFIAINSFQHQGGGIQEIILRPYRNLAVDLLDREVLDLATANDNGRHSFQTPFIDLDKFDGTAITIQDSITPYIKILATLKPTDPNADQTPVVYVLTYEIPAAKINTIDNGTTLLTEYPMTCEQRMNDTLGITKIPGVASVNTGTTQNLAIILGDNSNNAVTLNAANGVNLVQADNYIKVKSTITTALSAGGSVQLKISSTGACVAGGDAKEITGYFGNCNVNPLARLIRYDEDETAATELNNEIETQLKLFDNVAYLYPNPNNGNFTLAFNKTIVSAKLLVTNAIGMIVYETTIENSDKFDLSLAGISKGIYFLAILSNEKIKPIKFIVQ